jgi:antitoxin ParD1/3/4
MPMPGGTKLMNVSLTPQLAGFVRGAVKSGLYNNASEVMREALRMLKQEKERQMLRGVSEDIGETARRIKAAQAAVRRGEYTDYDETGLRNLGKKIISDVHKEKKKLA